MHSRAVTRMPRLAIIEFIGIIEFNVKIKGDKLGLAQQQTYILGPGPGYGHKQGSGLHSFSIQDGSSCMLDGWQDFGCHRFGGMLGGNPQPGSNYFEYQHAQPYQGQQAQGKGTSS